MKQFNKLITFLIILLLGGLLSSCQKDVLVSEQDEIALKSSGEDELSPIEYLGKQIFFDENISVNGNMSCATCHAAEVGFVGPDSDVNLHGAVYEGSVPGAFGDRKPPTAAYGGESPVLYFDTKAGLWIGGMFWDGRATGWRLGDPLAEQAQGPFLNPVEHGLVSASEVIAVIQGSDYAGLFEEVYGEGSLDEDVDLVYDRVGYAIAAYERSAEVNPFSSKFDLWLRGEAKLTQEERKGKAIFQGKGKCSKCHLIQGNAPLFTDFTFDNLGIPKNPENPVYVTNPGFIDPGLGGFLQHAVPGSDWQAELGKHKVPTLRNVDRRPYPGFVKAFGHNGYFKSLEEIVHFYNTRDVPGEGWNGIPWPAPEVAENVNTAELGNLRLTPQDEAALVAFLRTLSDGYVENSVAEMPK